MTIDDVLQLIRAKWNKELNSVQELVLRQVWDGQTYTNIATTTHYGEHYLRNTASALWQVLSEITNLPITKANFRPALESRGLTAIERELIKEYRRRQQPLAPGEFPGGPVPLGSPFYIDRPPIEALTYQEITKPGSVIRIKAPRKMGKSSLMLRILNHAIGLGYHTVSLDFQQAEEAVFQTLDKFLRWFCANVSRQLQMPAKLDEYWDEDMGSKVSCTVYFQAYLLETSASPIVLGLNEVNRVFEYPKIAQEFLPLLRSWHEESKRIITMQKLRLIVLHSTEIYIPLKLTQSPFNVGLPIHIPGFNPEQVMLLADRYGIDWTKSSDGERLMKMVGGHPYLIRLALYHIAIGNLTLDELLESAPTMAGIYKNYLQGIWATLQEQPEIAAAFKQVIKMSRGVELEPILAYKLDSMGLVNLDGNYCTVSCNLYRQYFSS
ncbi:MAG TPA: AAA-like domain-containing protein [Oscillatoriaceae cyanobacterium M33_DOE_052]|uniref:vWA-MoxR associated protein N-terminal HTH domain-containing protein n=1 Tax=Planktothricoides sp. SpSt-374 TaxID=2282167 RepID=A0A7C3ZX73_9CYAN|nr:AAA-like domain-containing protein [Oscillatoriaceae cyanobacterium M33_DOE_052]